MRPFYVVRRNPSFVRSAALAASRGAGSREPTQTSVVFSSTWEMERYRRPAPSFAHDALAVMRAHAWPGNVRELEHWVESAVFLAPDGHIRAARLPRLRMPATITPVLRLTLDEAMRRHATAMVDACAGNKAEAARRLAIGRNTLGRLLTRDARATRRSAG